MFRDRIAIVALGLLLVAFQSTSPAAVSQKPQQDRVQVSAKGDPPVPDDAVFTPLPRTADDETSEFAKASKEPKAEAREPGRLLELQRDLALPVSAGTGGGDVAESEPNNSYDYANLARDLPFECTGEISAYGDVDFVRVDVTAGIPIEIDVFADLAYLSSPLDPAVVVFDTSLHPIAYNDDVSYPYDLNSRVNFVAPYTGPIYVAVGSATSGAGPGYTYVLAAWPTVTPVFDNWEVEPNDTAPMADPIVLPGVKCGTLTADGDVDMTWFEASGGAQLVVDLHSRVYGMPLDSVVELFDSNGHILFLNDDADSVRDSRFNLVIPQSGYYYLRIRDYSGTGSNMHGYILSVSLQDRATSPVMTKLKFVNGNELKKVTGYNFAPSGATVEVLGVPMHSVTSAAHPTTVIKVKPRVSLQVYNWVTVVNPDGRRSNPYVRLPS
jgi:hypothetical protein